MKYKIGKLAAVFTVVCALCLALSGCSVQVTVLKLELPESINVGESAAAALSADYDNAEAGDADKEKALAELEIVWASSDEAVATVDESGNVTGVTGGSAVISATAGELKAEKEITVLVPLTGIETPKTLELAINKTDSAQLGAKPIPANASVKGEITYASSNEGVATIDAAGTVTAVAEGEAVITATLEGKSAKTQVTVTTAATGIELEKAEGILYIGGSYTIKAHTVPSEAPASSYTFTSSDSKIATVNEDGLVTGKSAGTAAITVKSAEGFEAVYTITVKAKSAASQGGGTGTTSGGATGGATGGGGTTGGDAGTGTPPSSQPDGPACGLVGPGHTEVGYCPICDLENGGWTYGKSDGQQGDGLGGDGGW